MGPLGDPVVARGATVVKLVFVYLGPEKKFPGWTLELLPRFDIYLYQDDGYLAIAWLFWAVELQWEYHKCAN